MSTWNELLPGELTSEVDVRAWFDRLLDGGINFHPEDDFDTYVDRDGEPFPASIARQMNEGMDKASELCADVCEVGAAAFHDFFERGDRG